MDHRKLSQFLALAQQLHFAKAAAQLHISAPTLSRNIRMLEDEVGAVLFDRNKRSVQLTKQGKAFETYAQNTLTEWQRFRASIGETGVNLSGELTLYSSVTATYSFCYQLLRSIAKSYPQIEVKLSTGDPALAVEKVLSGEADIAIAAKPDELHPQLAFHFLGSSPLIFIGPNDNGELATVIAQHKKNIAELPLGKMPFIVPEQGLSKKRLAAWWKEHQIKPQIYSHVAGNEAVVSMVSLGFGIALIPEIVVENSPLKDKVQKLDVFSSVAAFEIGVVVKKQYLQQPIGNAIWQLITAE
jgi:LysR family positive regulator for ilvC